MVDWSQDEILPSPLPLLIRLQNIGLVLEDDTPPPPGIPTPPPVNLSVSTIVVRRNRGGELEISNQEGEVEPNIQVCISRVSNQMDLDAPSLLVIG